MLKLLKKLKLKDWLLLIVAVGILVFSVWLDLKLPDYMKEITSLVETDVSDMGKVWIAGGKMLLCALGGTACTIVAGFISAYISADLSYNVREDLFNHVIDLDAGEIKKFSTPSLITRTTNDITQIQMVVSMGLSMMIKSPILAIWAVIKIINKSWQLSVVTAIAVVIIVGTILIIMMLVLPRFKIVQRLTDGLNRIARETLTGVKVVRAFNAEEYEEDKFEKTNKELIDTQIFNRTTMSFLMPTMTIVMSGLTLAIYWLGAYLVNQTDMMNKVSLFSDVIVFSSYAMYVITAFMMLTMIFMMLPRAEVSADRINEVLDTPLTIKEGIDDQEKEEKGTVEFKNVSFHYGDGENVLEDISFKVEKGQTLAFIGATGSGKTTLVNLVARIYDTSKGEVLIDGVNVKDYTYKNLYDKIGYIPQKTVMFSDTVKNNIMFGEAKQEVTEDTLNKSLEISQSKDFVSKLPNGLDSKLAEGATNISGGQKQRLSIARAIAREPEILIFDDSFSALDYKTDKELRKQIKEKLSDTTCLIVAQRIGTIKNADQIIVLEDGKIVGKGTHHELLKNCPVYQEIASSQLSKEEIEKGDK